MDAKIAAKTISESDYGIHCLLIYSNLTILREFYSHYIPEQIKDKEEIIQIMPFYETENSVREALSKRNKKIEIDKIEKEEKTLFIADSLGKYIGQTNVESIWQANKDLVTYAKELRKNGVSILGDMGSFIFEKRIQDLVDYELNLPTRFEMNLKGVCMYHQTDFDSLPEDMRQTIIDHHETSIKI
jgi:hypothetical protein